MRFCWEVSSKSNSNFLSKILDMCCRLTRCMSGYAGHIAADRGMAVLEVFERRDSKVDVRQPSLVGACTRRCGISASACLFSQCLAEDHRVCDVAQRHAILLALALQPHIGFLLADFKIMLQDSLGPLHEFARLQLV